MSATPPQARHGLNGPGLFHDAWLVVQLARRDIQTRYKGSQLGWVWAIVTPLLMLGVYTLVFKYIFRVRWPGAGEGPVEFALQLFAGLIVFQAAAECWGRSSRLIVDQPHLVKKVRFPLALLPWAPVINSLFHAGISMVLLMIAAAALGFPPRPEWLLLPLLLAPLGLLLWAVSLALACLGVFMRDLPQIVTLIIGLMQFLTPVFYPISALPPLAQSMIGWNVLAVYIEQIRALMFHGEMPTAQLWFQSLSVSLVLIALAYGLYRRTRPGFADVL